MIKPIKLSDVASALSAQLVGIDTSFERVSTDTRAVAAGDLFVALRGDNFDAHDFLLQAQSSGACAVVVDKACADVSVPQLIVQDTTIALGEVSALARSHFGGQLIAITGSCGKTSVKEMVASILSTVGQVHATRGNFNNHIGMPLTLLNLSSGDDFAVIEMGASAGGEIEYLTTLAKPGIALVNNVMPAHVEGFGSVDAIARAKAEIYHGLDDAGIAIINLDDNYAGDMICELETKRRMTFSLFDCSADVYAKNIRQNSQGTLFTLCSDKSERDVQLHVIGQHNLANALAAASCAIAAGANLDSVVQGLQNFEAVKGRLNISDGRDGCTVIDDSYNANPGSVRAAIDAVKGMGGDKILVLGDMAELGSEAKTAHVEVGSYAKESGFNYFYGVGELSAFAAKEFGNSGFAFSDQAKLIEQLLNNISADSKILVKGSRSASMEVVAQALKQEKTGAQQ